MVVVQSLAAVATPQPTDQEPEGVAGFAAELVETVGEAVAAMPRLAGQALGEYADFATEMVETRPGEVRAPPS